ncbi:MAG: glycogen/starch/alpha-glucan phosphorylase [Acidobacteria bacterium]|nr:glycogen/starch/alpha-glucan phosphorylase [Acidobacteriota bacterium]
MADQFEGLRQDEVRVGMDAKSIKEDFRAHLNLSLGKDGYIAKPIDYYHALALSVRDRLMDRWVKTQQAHYRTKAKRVYYLSLEFLMGRVLNNNLLNLNLHEPVGQAFDQLGLDLDQLRNEEMDMGLGNGGLGRLAACYIDSMATLDIPAIGYGIRYNYGIFRQQIEEGRQIEHPDDWLKWGNPWEIPRAHRQFTVHFGGELETQIEDGVESVKWVKTTPVIGIPYDVPIAGYQCKTVNTLRLWSAHATEDFDFNDFNQGDYIAAVESKVMAENLTKVLYPNDMHHSGKELRLRQQYLFVSCSLQDIVRRFKNTSGDWQQFPQLNAIQMNDTHPSLAVAELMRILVDQEQLEWDHAWSITVQSLAYTNHTLMPEALETWSAEMLKKLLPRPFSIIQKINEQFLAEVAQARPNDLAFLNKVSIIEPGRDSRVRMANLAIVGSHKVNGVAALHTDLLKQRVVPEFASLYPDRFASITNGITQRRWLLHANPGLAQLITDAIGDGWVRDLSQLRRLDALVTDRSFAERFDQVKLQNKQRLTEIIQRKWGWTLNPHAMFDIHIKRFHEYKRQLMNALHMVMLYNRLKANPGMEFHPQIFLIAGKAAPGYFMAKLFIKLINDIGQKINNDPEINEKLGVYFLPNYGVTMAERLVPAANISEQISTAGYEASGTGNMKFMLNGALTIGTLDGANIEMAEEVGRDNMFIFGLNADEVHERRQSYQPRAIYEQNPEIKAALDLIFSGYFSDGDNQLYNPIRESLLDHGDYFMVLADLDAFSQAQQAAQAQYRDLQGWTQMAIRNTAAAGKFSSDRSIAEYAHQIWNVPIRGT